MLYIKLDDDMDLTITVNEPIYRGDNLNQKITYLVPKLVNEIDKQPDWHYHRYKGRGWSNQCDLQQYQGRHCVCQRE